MDMDFGSAPWYIAILIAGLVTGIIIQWMRREMNRDE